MWYLQKVKEERYSMVNTTKKYFLSNIGLGKVNIELSVVSERGECQLLDAFYQIKNFCC